MNKEIQNVSFYQMGTFCSCLAGLSYVIIVICAFMSPQSVASYVTSNQYFVDFEHYKNYFIFLKSLLAIANAAMIGVVISLYALRNSKKEGWLTFLSVLAIVGLGIGMLQSIIDAKQVPHLALEYEQSSPVIKHVIIAFGVANPAIYILSLGIPGIWFLFVNFLYVKKFPPFLVILGIIWGLGNILTVIAHLFVIIWLIYFVAAGALIGAPLWSIWQGRYLWKMAKNSPDNESLEAQ